MKTLLRADPETHALRWIAARNARDVAAVPAPLAQTAGTGSPLGTRLARHAAIGAWARSGAEPGRDRGRPACARLISHDGWQIVGKAHHGRTT